MLAQANAQLLKQTTNQSQPLLIDERGEIDMPPATQPQPARAVQQQLTSRNSSQKNLYKNTVDGRSAAYNASNTPSSVGAVNRTALNEYKQFIDK